MIDETEATTSGTSPFAAGYPAHMLHIEPRPFLLPCARCGDDTVNNQAPIYANITGQAVCDLCVNGVPGVDGPALDIVREVDATFGRITGPHADVDPEDLRDARDYLTTVACGVFELLSYYADDDALRLFETVAKAQISRRLARTEAGR